jgi:gluconate 5-dehydrogenase
VLTLRQIRVSLRAVNVRDLFDLSGRAALVTGGGRGIGRAIAEGLAEAGAHVFLASRKRAACEAAAAEIEARGGRATALACDLTKPESLDVLVAEVLAATPRLHVLVNNAGFAWAAPFYDFPLEGWDRTFGVNVRGVFWLSRQVARHMREAGGGSIVNVSSLSAFFGASDAEQPVVAYMASKGAVEALTRAMAVKLAPDRIRVNAIAPGPFDTDMLDHIRKDPAALARHNMQVPLGRPGTRDDIKGVAVFLASDAASFVTGATLRVDGGISAVYPVKKLGE